MDFQLLGSVEVIDRERSVLRNILPTAPKTRQVLALLTLRRNTVVKTSELIDELWESDPPVSAMTTLQTYVYKLRKTMAEHGARDIVVTRSGGYTLRIPDVSVDIHHFEHKAAQGRAYLENDDATRASALLHEALQLWRGPALADVVTGKLLSVYATALDELRNRTLELRIEADLRLGRHRELISELKALVRSDPLNENLHASLISALYFSGRRHEALNAYQNLRTSMIEELGLEPGQRLRELHQAVLADALPDPPGARAAVTLVPAPRTPEPEAAARVPVAVEAPATAEPAQEPPAQGPPAQGPPAQGPPAQGPWPPPPPPPAARETGGVLPPEQLAPDIPDFVGHADLLGEARTRMAGAPPHTMVITGMPGVGKTTLAVRIAHTLRHCFDDGVLYAELSDSDARPTDVLHGFLRALGTPCEEIPADRRHRASLFRSYLEQRRLLIVLDDARSTDEVQDLLPRGPGSAAIVTSRRRLYGLPAAWRVDLRPLTEDEAVEMLGRIVGAERVNREPAAAAALAGFFGHLPLALRCLGARLDRMPDFPLAAMLDELSAARYPIEELQVEDLDVRSRFDHVYERLSPLEQSTYRLLCLLPHDGFTAEQVAGLLGWQTFNARRVLERLVDGHLVGTESTAEDGIRYVLPRISRLYTRERLLSLLVRDWSDDGLEKEIIALLDELRKVCG